MTSVATLPGIAFEVVPRPLDDALPRMDVCGFVGFASRGPVDVPVAIEDPVAFRNVFGDDPVLARTDDGDDVHALLGPAVEAFFANGGRRAWVVRVARTGEGGAVVNRFGVPGLVVPVEDDGAGPRWQLASFPARSPGSWSDRLAVGATLEVTTFAATLVDSGHVVVDLGSVIEAGDLLRIPVAETSHLLVAASSVGHHDAARLISFEPTSGWLVTEDPVVIATGPAHRLVAGSIAPVASLAIASFVSESVVEVDDTETIATGDLITIDAAAAGEADTFVTVGEELFDALLVGTRRFEIDATVAIGPAPGDWDTLIVDPAVPRSMQRQRVRLTVRDGHAIDAEISSLGLGVEHPRAIQQLPDDDRLFSLVAGLPRARPDHEVTVADFVDRSLTALELETISPRFPLAGTTSPIVLPIGLTTDPTGTIVGSPPAEIELAPAPTRNGLGQFDASLFVDPALAALGTDTIMPTAWDLAYVQFPPRRLRGVHALATNDDVTIVCIPDAVHTGWDQMTIVAPPPLTAPALSIDGVDGKGLHLVWTENVTATGYELEHGPDPDWTMPRRVEVTEVAVTLTDWSGCAEPELFRVRAVRGSEVGPWSNVVGAVVPATTFEPCEPVAVAEASAEHAADPLPDQVVWRSRGAEEAAPWPELRAIQTAVLRWCAARGDVFAVMALPNAFRAEDAIRHVDVLRRGSAGDDLSPFLAAGIPAMTDDETGILGYGALFHPWPVVGTVVDGSIRAIAPDGGVAGTYAARALERGAWIAPARIPLTDVVATSPPIGDDRHLALVTSAIDPVAADPSGYMVLTANTMSPVAATRPVNVRRLIMLLRRLARREGAGIVFEPNDRELQRLVVMRFERVLTRLFQRGAFAGAVPAEAFEVSTGSNVNPPGSVERGRFVVEVRFAPSRPLEFITVRLVLAGPTVVEERS